MPSPYPPDLTDAELVEETRRTHGNITYGPIPYLEELDRRTTVRQAEDIRDLTRRIYRLTWAVVIVGAGTLVLSGAALAIAWRGL